MRYLRVALCFMMFVIPAAAQDDDAVVVDLGALELVLPEGWYVPEEDYESFYTMEDDLEAIVILHDTGLEALLVSPEKVAELVPDADDLSYQDILVELTALAYPDLEMDDESFFGVDLGAIDGVRWFYADTESIEDDVLQGDLYLIPLTDGGYLYADIYTFQSYFEEDVETLELAMEDLFLSAGAVEIDGCFISTTQADFSTVRVEPDETGAALFFLPVDQDFTAIAGFVAEEDEAVWYQLDKDSFDGNIDAAELWVAQADVDTVGNCDIIED